VSDPIEWSALRDAARAVMKNAYAPYSAMRVGAAVLAGGRIFAGCNVESASYPVGVCAERSALAAAVAAGCQEISAVAIAAERPVPPCGMCRQALAEFNPAVPILLVGEQDEREARLDRLLPDPFL
jgi:cytidine deaminase